MAGETEAASEEIITPNEGMRVLISGGPRHYVLVNIADGASESWGVDHKVVEVTRGDVVGFRSSEDAEHFISRGRAIDLGRWNNETELRAAYAEHERRQAEQTAATPEPEPEAEPEQERPAETRPEPQQTRHERRNGRNRGH